LARECNGSAISPIGLRTGKGASFLQYPFWAKYKRLAPISYNKLNIDENSELKPEFSSIFFTECNNQITDFLTMG
jgi:hypothetical protein